MSKKILLQFRNDAEIFACIHDLVTNGLSKERFGQGEMPPNRQDVTQFLASWSLLAGLSQEQCSAWLTEYCVDVLSAISRSSLSQIRHSTKSNIKFIYRQAGKFVCRGPHNIFKAACDQNCPLYQEQLQLYEAYVQEQNTPRKIEYKHEPRPPAPPPIAIKDRYRQQFEEAVKVIREKILAGSRMNDIVAYLHEKGYKTRTGKEWNSANLRADLVKLNIPWPNESPHLDDGPPLRVKDRYRLQFEYTVKMIREKILAGVSVADILAYLNENGLKTRTGRAWTMQTLRTQLNTILPLR